MGHHRRISRSSEQLNQIEQATQTCEEEVPLGLHATPSFDHSTEDCSSVYQCTEIIDLAAQPCSKEYRQTHDTDTCVLTPLIDPVDDDRHRRFADSNDETTDLSLVIVPSSTVTALPPSVMHIDNGDTAEWLQLSIIENASSHIFSRFVSLIGSSQRYDSVETLIEHFRSESPIFHLIIYSNPESTEALLPLTSLPMVKKIYIYCPRDRLDEFDAFSACYPGRVIVFQQQDTLILLVLWDLATYFKDLGRQYDAINRTNEAQSRYRSAYRLRVIIQSELTNQMQIITDNRQQ